MGGFFVWEKWKITHHEQFVSFRTFLSVSYENEICIVKNVTLKIFFFVLRIEWGPPAWIRFQLWVPSLVENGARLSRCGCDFIHLSPTQSTEKSRHRSESTHKLTRYDIGKLKKGRCWSIYFSGLSYDRKFTS